MNSPLLTRRNAIYAALITISCVALVACGSDGTGTSTPNTTNGGSAAVPPAKAASEADVTKVANENIASWANDGTKKVAFFADSKAVDEVAGGKCASTSRPGGPGGEGSKNSDGCDNKFDADEAAKDIRDWFSEHLFNKKFQDKTLSTEKLVVYCFAAEDVCGGGDKAEEPRRGGGSGPGGDGSGDKGGGGGGGDKTGGDKIDPKCAEGLKKVPVCVGVAYHGEKLLTGVVQVGKDPQVVPATFKLTPATFSVEVDLGKLVEAAKMVAKATGEELPEEFPTIAKGKLEAALNRTAEGKMITGTISFTEAVHVAAFTKTDHRFYEVKLAKALDALKIVLGKQDRTVVGALNVGKVDVGAALDLFFGKSSAPCASDGPKVPGGKDGGDAGGGKGDPNCGKPAKKDPKKGALFLALAGLTANVDFAVSADKKKDTFTINGLGLGPATTTASYDDGAVHPLGTIDLNAKTNPARKVNLAFEYDGDRLEVTTTPSLDLVVGHTLAALAKELDDDIPTFLHAGHTSIALSGDAKPAMEFEFGGDEKTTSVPKPIPGGSGGGDKGEGGQKGDGEGPAGEGGDKGSDFPHMKVLTGSLLLKAWGLGSGLSDVLVTVKAGMCLGEKDGKSGSTTTKTPGDGPKDGGSPGAGSGGDGGGGDGSGSDGGKSDKMQEHFFAQMIETACK